MKESFNSFYERSHTSVFRFIYLLSGGSKEDAEDFTAETYLRAWNAWPNMQKPAQEWMAWILMIARNLVIDSYRKTKFREQSIELEENDVRDSAPEPEEQVATYQRQSILLNLLTELSGEEKEILILRYMLDWRVKDIAVHIGKPENTVSVTIRRLISKLRERWPVEG